MGVLRLISALVAVGLVAAACGGGGGPEITVPPSTLPVPEATQITAAGETRSVRWGRVYQQCLIDSGFPAELHPDGRVSMTDFGSAQRDVVQAVSERCSEIALEAVPREPLPSSEAEWRELYDFEIALAECLARYGFRSDPPSFERWMDSGGEAWSAYDAVPDSLSREEWNGINNACPQAFLVR